ncbi:hypothetical protein R3P38DRAFT_3193834 [Favolaschia claudopus]|uniref:F-box domain-containing protein n=1 Tax=Favolaschia claudopus TaxID=2862362 RepID=A0AAW0BFP8_9AGAR
MYPPLSTQSASSQNGTLPSMDPHMKPSTISRDILDTNDPPDELELKLNLATLREFVARGIAYRILLDARISALAYTDSERDKLFEERNTLDLEIRKHKGAMSPFRRVPTEILSLIFSFVVQPDQPLKHATHYHMTMRRSGAWPLSTVCSRWRSIAVSQPDLWTLFVLRLDPGISDSIWGAAVVAETLSIVKIQIDRSRNAPLKLLFIASHDSRWNSEFTECERQALDLLTPHLARCEELRLSATPPLYEFLSTSWSGRFSALRVLKIHVHSQFGEIDLDLGHIFASCPKLEEALIYLPQGYAYGDVSPAAVLSLDTTSLRRYRAQTTWERHAELLRAAPHLVDCVLALPEPYFYHLPEGKTIQLPGLLRLSVSDLRLLDLLDTPALQELYCPHYRAEELDYHLREFPKLRKLFVGESYIDNWSSFMRSVRTITSLCMYFRMNSAPAIFEFLESSCTPASDDRDSHIDFPALHTLGLCFGPEDSRKGLGKPIDQNQLMRAVEAQWRYGQLRSFRMYAMGFEPSESTVKRVEALCQEGMEFDFAYSSKDVYEEMVPEDFRLYDDGYGLIKDSMEAGDCYSFSTT